MREGGVANPSIQFANFSKAGSLQATGATVAAMDEAKAKQYHHVD